jgi:hypothetical protein
MARLLRNAGRIFISKDEKCFVSFHPDIDFDYENTRPMPKLENENSSALKVDSTNMITKAPNLEQIQQLTFTPKSYWRQDQGRMKREKYKKYFDESDIRRGLTF